MFEYIDRKIKLDICITAIATIISVNFIVSSYIWKDYAAQILSILVIVLPTIYIIGNLIIRGIMDKEIKDLRREYEEGLIDIGEGIEEMRDEIDLLRKKWKS